MGEAKSRIRAEKIITETGGGLTERENKKVGIIAEGEVT